MDIPRNRDAQKLSNLSKNQPFSLLTDEFVADALERHLYRDNRSPTLAVQFFPSFGMKVANQSYLEHLTRWGL